MRRGRRGEERGGERRRGEERGGEGRRGEEGWCSDESTPLPPMWLGFDSNLVPYVG